MLLYLGEALMRFGLCTMMIIQLTVQIAESKVAQPVKVRKLCKSTINNKMFRQEDQIVSTRMRKCLRIFKNKQPKGIKEAKQIKSKGKKKNLSINIIREQINDQNRRQDLGMIQFQRNLIFFSSSASPKQLKTMWKGLEKILSQKKMLFSQEKALGAGKMNDNN